MMKLTGKDFFLAGGKFDQFTDGFMLVMKVETINRRGKKRADVRKNIDDISAPDARAVRSGDVCNRFARVQRKSINGGQYAGQQ